MWFLGSMRGGWENGYNGAGLSICGLCSLSQAFVLFLVFLCVLGYFSHHFKRVENISSHGYL